MFNIGNKDIPSPNYFQLAAAAGSISPAIIDVLGRGMNVMASTPIEGLGLSIFDWEKSGSKTVEIDGISFEIPTITSVIPDSVSLIRHGAESSITAVSNKLSASTNVGLQGYGAFSGGMKASFEMSNSKHTQAYYAFIEDNITYADILLDSLSPAFFSDEFAADLEALPTEYDGDNYEPFGNFFDKWGLYFVSKASLGGALNACNAVTIHEATTLVSATLDLNAQYKGLFATGSFDASVTGTASWDVFATESHTQLQIYGGSLKTQQALLSLDLMSPGSASVDAVGAWADTIPENPSTLGMQVLPIAQLAGSKKTALEQASQDYLTSVQFNTFEKRNSTIWWGDFSGRSTVIINNQLQPQTDTTNPGYQVLVLKRTAKVEVISNKFYSYDKDNWQKTYEAMYDQMLQDLGPLDHDHIVVLCSVDLFVGAFPTSGFVQYLTGQLGVPSTALASWTNSISGAGSDDEGVQLFYVVGVPGQGPGTAATLSEWMANYSSVKEVMAITGGTVKLGGGGGASILSFQGI